MPVPKTGRIWPYLRRTLRNAPVIHKLESMAWQHSAEGFAQPAERIAAVTTAGACDTREEVAA